MYRKEVASKLLRDSKAQEGLVNALNSGDTVLVAGRHPLLDTLEIGPREPLVPPQYDKGMVSPQRPISTPNLSREYPCPEQDNSI